MVCDESDFCSKAFAALVSKPGKCCQQRSISSRMCYSKVQFLAFPLTTEDVFACGFVSVFPVDHGAPRHHVSCRTRACPRGRRCLPDKETGRAHCVCQDRCRPTFVPVCGSDGRFYENHCEVYRTSCLQKRKIYVLHSRDCFFKGEGGERKRAKEGEMPRRAERQDV
ncbi:hypothetical protein Z043-104433 [Arapaima gigas]